MPSTPRRPTREQVKARLKESEEPEARHQKAVDSVIFEPVIVEEVPPEEPKKEKGPSFISRTRSEYARVKEEDRAKEEARGEGEPINIPHPPRPAVPAATEQRVNKPPNYKLHVITALTLSAAMTALARGFSKTAESIKVK